MQYLRKDLRMSCFSHSRAATFSHFRDDGKKIVSFYLFLW